MKLKLLVSAIFLTILSTIVIAQINWVKAVGPDPLTAPISGAVLYWNMDEINVTNNCSSVFVLDHSGNGNDGLSCAKNKGPLVTVSGGKFGRGTLLTGVQQYLKALNNSSLTPNNEVTASLWLKLTSYNGSYPRILSKSGSYELVLLTTPGQNQGKVQWKVRNPNGPSGEEVAVGIFSSNKLSLGTWNHIVGTYDGNTSKLFINGVKVAEQTNIGGKTILDAKQPVTMGAENVGDRNLAGIFDEVRIFNRAISDSEVTQLYNFIP